MMLGLWILLVLFQGFLGIIQRKKQQIDKLNAQAKQYQDDKIDEKIAQYHQLATYRQQYEDMQADLRHLQKDASEITEYYYQDKLQLQEEFAQQQKIKQEQHDRAIDDMNFELDELNKKKQKLDNQKTAEYNQLINNQQKDEQELAQDIYRYYDLLNTITYSTKEQAELDSYDHQLQRLKKDHQEIRNRQQDNQKSQKDSQYRLDNRNQEYRQLEEVLDQYGKQYQKIYDIIYGDGTLLAFLRRSNHDWQPIAKLINPALLFDKNLNPAWIDNDDYRGENGNSDEIHNSGDSFYGLQLATDHLHIPQEAQDDKALREKYNDLDQKINTKQSEIAHKKAQIQAEQKQLKQYQEDDSSLTHKLTQITDEEQLTEQARRQAGQRFDENVAVRKQKIKDDIAQRQANQEILKQNHHNERIAFNSRFENQREQLNEQETKLKQQQQAIRQAFLANKQADSEAYEQRLDERHAIYMQALSDKGVDRTMLAQKEQKAWDINQQIQTIESYYEMIKDYEYWLANDYGQKDEWQEQLFNKQNECNQQQSKYNALQNAFEGRGRQYERIHDELDKQLKAIQDKNSSIAHRLDEIQQALLSHDEAIDTLTAVKSDSPDDVLLKLSDNCLDVFKKASREIKDLTRRCKGQLTGKLEQVWIERMKKYQQDDFSWVYYIYAAQEMIEMMADEIPTQKSITLDAFYTISYMIKEYNEQLDYFNKKVHDKSKDISKKINNEHRFLALEDITISLSSVVDKYGHEDLRRFVKLYDEEMDGHHRDILPSPLLLKRYHDAIVHMQTNKLDTDNIASLIELNISYQENGRAVLVRHDEDLLKGSSTGLSILLIVVIFASLTRYLCDDPNTIIHWSIDEIGKLDDGNIKKLFDFMNRQKVQLFCAQPNPNPVLNKLFVHKNDIHRTIGVRHYMDKSKSINPAIIQALQSKQGFNHEQGVGYV